MTSTSIIRLGILLSVLLMLNSCAPDESPASVSYPRVLYQKVAVEKVPLKRELPGRVSAFRVSEVRPQVSGILTRRFFEEGADVQAGQILYQIDPALYQAAYNNAKANLGKVLANEEAARLLAERYTRLVKSNAVSVQDRDDAIASYNQIRAEIEASKQALQSAEINLGYTRITAPVSGRIGRSFVTEGALVTQNQEQPLATIQQLSPVYIDLTQPSVQLVEAKQAVAKGTLQNSDKSMAKVRLYLEGGAPYTIPGTDAWLEGDLLFSDVSVNENTGSVVVRATFDNPEGMLLPGMYVRAEIIEGLRNNAILIPQKSVARDTRNRPQVFVLRPSKAEQAETGLFEVAPKLVDVDRDYNGRWLIRDGLEAGELLVVEGLQKVRPGQIVAGEAENPAHLGTKSTGKKLAIAEGW